MNEENQGDSVDFPFPRFSKKKAVSEVPQVITIKGPKDCEEYVKYPKKGKCYIFNHEEFVFGDLDKREGTNIDCKALKDQFTKLDFDVEVFPNFTVGQVNDKLLEAGKKVNHEGNGCFVCCILTHGVGEHYLCAKDGIYPIKDVFEPFQGDKCPSLVNKPKLFFIQACRGSKTDPAVVCRESLDSNLVFRIPVQADFLIAHSTVPGYVAWREKSGSWFIQSFCDVLKQYAQQKDVLQILTIVCRRVSFNCSNTYDIDTNLKTQIPCITSTLRRDFKFI